eukprot:Clim_evm64s11 gene=Clim_evmTU64s11
MITSLGRLSRAVRPRLMSSVLRAASHSSVSGQQMVLTQSDSARSTSASLPTVNRRFHTTDSEQTPAQATDAVKDDGTVCGTCWSCKEELGHHEDMFCDTCEVVQPPRKDATYFDLMKVEPGMQIDEKELTKRFRELQWLLHPDKYHQRTKEEQRIAPVFSSVINKAYSTLKDPMSRALYLLKLHKKELEEHEGATDQALLMQIMEANETLAEAESYDEVHELRDENRVFLNQATTEASKAFSEGDIDAARAAVIRMQYYNNIDKACKEWEPGKPVVITH